MILYVINSVLHILQYRTVVIRSAARNVNTTQCRKYAVYSFIHTVFHSKVKGPFYIPTTNQILHYNIVDVVILGAFYFLIKVKLQKNTYSLSSNGINEY